MPRGTDDTAVAQALAEAVRRAGPALGTQPRRVRAMLTDVLGSRARDHRAEVEAVVSAAELDLPRKLATGRGDPAQLRATGMDADLARFAADAWGYALGETTSGALPPTLSTSRPGSSPATSPGRPVAADPTVLPYWPPGGPPYPNPRGTDPNTGNRHPSDFPDRPHPAGGRSRKPVWLGLAAAVAVIAVVALVAVIATQYQRNQPATTVAQKPVTTTQPVTLPSSAQPVPPSARVTSVVPPAQPEPRTQQPQPAPRTPRSQPAVTQPPTQPVANRVPVKQYDPTFTAQKTCSGELENWYIYALDQFSDPDGDDLKITSATASVGTAQVTSYGDRPYTISWTEPTVDAYGTAYVNFTVADNRGGTTPGLLTITVPPNQC